MLYTYLAVIGALAVLLAFVSKRIRYLPLSEPLLGLLLGILIGPQVLGLVDVAEPERAGLLLDASRLLLAISLMAIALRYPVVEMRQHVPTVALLVLVVMPGMAAVSAGLSAWIIGLPVASAWLLGATLCPTDPVLASNVVTGEPAEHDLPARLRQVLSLESGVNDGLVLPLVILGLVLVKGESLASGLLDSLYRVGVAAVLGVVLGAIAAAAMRRSEEHREVEQSAVFVFTLLLSLFVLGVAHLVRSDAVLAVFVAGLAYNLLVSPGERAYQETIDEGVNRFLVLPVFTLLGVSLPWQAWAADGWWPPVALALAVLALRRMPLILALRRPLRFRWADAAFLGWFGPVGVSALLYLTHSEEQGVTDPTLWAAGSAVIAASTLAHGLTTAPFRHAYRRIAGDGLRQVEPSTTEPSA